MAQMKLSTEKKIMDLENRLVAARGERERVGGIRSAGLSDANYCSWNGFTMRSCCVALRTLSRYLQGNTTMGGKIMYTCMCNLVPKLYSRGKKKKKMWYICTMEYYSATKKKKMMPFAATWMELETHTK